MKKAILSIVLILTIGFSAIAEEMFVSVKVSNVTHPTIKFSYIQNPLTDEEKIYILNLNQDGELYTLLNISKTKLLFVEYGDSKFEVFVDGFKDIEFSFDGSNVVETLSFTKDGAAENNILNQIRTSTTWNTDYTTQQIAFLDYKIPVVWADKAQQLDFASFQREVNNNYEHQKSILENTSSTLNPSFVEYYNKQLEIEYQTNLNTYFTFESNTAVETFQPKIITDYNRFSDFRYINHIILVINTLKVAGESPESGVPFEFYDLIQRKVKGNPKHVLHTKMLLTAQKQNFNRLAERKYNAFRKSSAPAAYISKVEEAYGSSISLDPDGFAPDFTLMNADGSMTSLSEYKGKVIYLSFWATWCKPCLSGFRKTEHVRRQLEDMGIVLINVSLDESEDLWRSTMSRFPMPGVNLIVGNDPTLQSMYDLSRLPAYYIIGKNGKFAYLSDDSDRNLFEEFQRLQQK